MSKNEPTFEETLKRLEAIAREIEEGRIGLEESIARYEEGMKLVNQCRKILTRAEQRIKKLQPTADDSLETGPFDAPAVTDERKDSP